MHAELDKRKKMQYYEKEFKTYDISRAFFEKGYFAVRERKLLSKFMDSKKGLIILNLACGTGRHFNFLSSKASLLIGLDLTREMLKVAKKKEEKALLVCGDAENLPFRDNIFDIINCSRAFKLFPNKLKACYEAYRCLRRGGRFILTEGVTDLLWVRWRVKVGHYEKETYPYDHRRLLQFFREARFKNISRYCVLAFPTIMYMLTPSRITSTIEDTIRIGRYVLVAGEKSP